jgi:preprotein translocase subunit YajC
VIPSSVLAQSGLDGWFVPILLILVIFYFIVMRPATKERKAREAQLGGLKKHDRVVTNAGIHGTVVALEDDTVVLRVDDKNNVRIRFSRQAIWQVVTASSDRAATEKRDEKQDEARAPEEAAS